MKDLKYLQLWDAYNPLLTVHPVSYTHLTLPTIRLV